VVQELALSCGEAIFLEEFLGLSAYYDVNRRKG